MNQKHAENRIMTVQSLSERIMDDSISLEHLIQRKAKQWDNKRKSNFIRRLLWGDCIQPILICSQNEDGYIQSYVIDGKQRMSTVLEFMNDEFAISVGTTKPIIQYTGILYETKEVKGRVRFVTKKNKFTGVRELVPVKDDKGNVQRGVQTFDIRGAKFSQLPPELQRALKDYNVPYMNREDCTDEEIQQEIIDFNSGMPMCVEQKGIAVLGTEWANKIADIKNSYFIKNCYVSTDSDNIKSRVERRIVESLCILYSEYKKNYEDMCKDISNMDEVVLEEYNEILDELATVVDDNQAIAQYLGHRGGREFGVILANYNHYRECGHANSELYRAFLINWINNLQFDKNIDDGDRMESYVDYYKTGTTDPHRISERIDYLNLALDDYLNQKIAV